MADITDVRQTTDNAGAAITAAYVNANAFKTLGDGAAGIGPYTRFGTPQLTAIKIVSASLDFTTTPTITNSLLSKVVRGVQAAGVDIFYVGKPHASTEGVIMLVTSNTLPRGGRGADLLGGTADTGETTYENVEEHVSLAAKGAIGDITITEVVLTGVTFA
jgi:hypothetical protein